MREIKKIIIHCSDSGFGDASIIDQWHRQRGWNGIGYHYVILNGCRIFSNKYKKEDDGLVEPGRMDAIKGAHCKGHNYDSIGICLIGKKHFTANQLHEALPELINKLKEKYSGAKVFGHYEFDSHKECPCIDMEQYRSIFVINHKNLRKSASKKKEVNYEKTI